MSLQIPDVTANATRAKCRPKNSHSWQSISYRFDAGPAVRFVQCGLSVADEARAKIHKNIGFLHRQDKKLKAPTGGAVRTSAIFVLRIISYIVAQNSNPRKHLVMILTVKALYTKPII